MFGDYIAFVATVDTHTLSMGIKRIGREPLAPESRKNSKKKDCGKRRPPPFTSSTPRLPLPVRHHSAIVHTNNTPVFFPLRNTRTASVAWGGAPKALTLYREIWARRDAIFFCVGARASSPRFLLHFPTAKVNDDDDNNVTSHSVSHDLPTPTTCVQFEVTITFYR